MLCYEIYVSIALHVDSPQESTDADDTTAPTDFTTNLWSKAGHLKLTLASSMKAGTANTVSLLRDTAKHGGSVLANSAWNTGVRLKDTAVVLRDNAATTGANFKDNFSEKAATFKDNFSEKAATLKDNVSEKAATMKDSAMVTGGTLKTNISDKARGMKAGLSATLSSLRSRTESYFNTGSDE